MIQVSIDPEDANQSYTYVPKENEPPSPAQAAFNGLVPGRAYNIRYINCSSILLFLLELSYKTQRDIKTQTSANLLFT